MSSPFYFITLIVSSYDAGLSDWTISSINTLFAIGIVGYVFSHMIMIWAKAVNNYFSSVVRIQTDRGQTVCREGPYFYLRHPGYLGGLLFGLSTFLVLGSVWGEIPALIAAIMLVVRTSLEDKMLQKELPGYAEYTRLVRYRLVPGYGNASRR